MPMTAPRYEALQREVSAIAHTSPNGETSDVAFARILAERLVAEPGVYDEFLEAKRRGRARLAGLLSSISMSAPMVDGFRNLLPQADEQLGRAESYGALVKEKRGKSLQAAVAKLLAEDGGDPDRSLSLAAVMGWWGVGRRIITGTDAGPGEFEKWWCDLSFYSTQLVEGAHDASMRELLTDGNGGVPLAILIGDLRVDEIAPLAQKIRGVEEHEIPVAMLNVFTSGKARFDAATGIFTYDVIVRPELLPNWVGRGSLKRGHSKTSASTAQWRKARDGIPGWKK